MDKVGILYICTGKYSIFWKGFYESARDYLFCDTEKHFFVWTDDEEIFRQAENAENIHTIYQEVERWPFPTLKRFDYFLNAREKLEKMDYLMFFNANELVREKISVDEILPRGNEKMFFTIHPWFLGDPESEIPYDRNPESKAYVEYGTGKNYYQGALYGGKTDDFLLMCERLSRNTEDDYKRGIIALWHDESHLNRYILDYKDRFRILSPAYIYPEDSDFPFAEKIVCLNKDKFGGYDFLRKRDE